jgi:hypothetical protein
MVGVDTWPHFSNELDADLLFFGDVLPGLFIGLLIVVV